MEELQVFLLGVIQGLTEFLPVSSSGHIEIFKSVFNITFLKNQGLLLTLVLHFATALSTIWVFKKDILKIFINNTKQDNRFVLNIIISMIPAVFVGLFFEKQINYLFNSNILLVGIMLLVTATLLYKTDKINPNFKSISLINAFLIGMIQAFSILPGISRSGATIAMAVFLGIGKNEAARFSFLMVIPLIFGSMSKSVLGFSNTENLDFTPILLIGFVSAFFTGIIACKLMIKLVKKSQLKYFGLYCFIVGLLVIGHEVI
ncbi:MAG: undecaprenyl-diphosphate phosphatase [Flavobacteriaceae bacterium]|nr:undecaprenyl-diphosphate phosphatase [Flavobacteriaceae bacterium]